MTDHEATKPAEVEATPKVNKSIVPAKYAGKYKGAGDALSTFLNDNILVDGKLDPAKLFAVCRANGIADEHIKPYEAAIEAKANGAPGRARMTLRNRLATLVRKNGKLVGLDGDEVELTVNPLPVREKAPVAEKSAGEAQESEAA